VGRLKRSTRVLPELKLNIGACGTDTKVGCILRVCYPKNAGVFMGAYEINRKIMRVK
jgi:hypothetical protein